MNDNQLMHFGVKGMKWGVRRYQNEDGSLTTLGKIRQKANSEAEGRYAVKVAKRKKTTSGDAAYQKYMTDAERLVYAKGRVKTMGSKAQAVRSETTKFASTTIKRSLAAIGGTAMSALSLGTYAGMTGAGAAAVNFALGTALGGGIGLATLGSVAVANTVATGYRYVKNMNAIRNVESKK